VTSGKIIKAVYVSYGYVYILCTSWSGRLEYNWLFVGLGGWGVRGDQRKRRMKFYELSEATGCE
jgi:hypothetical protein